MVRSMIMAVCLVLTLSSMEVRAQSVDVLLERAEKSIAKTISKVHFQSTQYSTQGKSLSITQGTMHLQGERFRLEYGNLTAVFANSTLSYYDRESNEFTISEPTQEDLSMLNPFYFLRMRAKGYQIESIASSDASLQGLRLRPKTKNSIRYVDLFMWPNTGLPRYINIYISDGTRSEIKIVNIQTLSSISTNMFSLSSKSYPGCEVIDLR